MNNKDTKKTVVCGNRNLLKYAQERIGNNPNYCIVDVYEQTELIDKDVICDSDVVFLAFSWYETEDWINTLKELGVENIYRIPVHAMQYKLPIFEESGEISKVIVKINTKVTDLPYLETHVTDICNLKCKGCMHFSNLATEPNFPDIDSFKRDFMRMKELFNNIFIIRLMGGEPLLNPQLIKYIEVVRQIFPAAEIRIVTNGLLIPKQKNEFWKSVHENYVSLDISPYPPTIEMIGEIKEILDSEGIPYLTGSSAMQKFRKSFTLTPDNDPEKAVKVCQSSHCRFLRNGYIAKCPLPLLIGDFNKKYKSDIKSEDYYNIYDEKTGYELKMKLDAFADMCSYCSDRQAFIDWSRTYNDDSIYDWVVM